MTDVRSSTTRPPPPARFTLFSTPLGSCGIAWSGHLVVATHLPERSEGATAARLSGRSSNAGLDEPPSAISIAIEAITALLCGERRDLSFIACDFTQIDPFRAKVYAVTRAIGPGETRTYGDIALELGDKRFAQSVGQALGRNPLPIIVPCHRVLGADGRLTGFSATGGVETKLRMLNIEGARIADTEGLFGDVPLAAKPRTEDGRRQQAARKGGS